MTEILKYVSFQSTAEPSFWMKLGEHKLNTSKLNEDPIPISASYGIVPSITFRDHNGNNKMDVPKTIPGRMRFDRDSIQDDTTNVERSSMNENILTRGEVVILNTIESFKTTNKNTLLEQHCLDKLLNTCGVSDNDSEVSLDVLTNFFCLTHLDLKNHKVFYWFAFPVLVPAPGKAIRYSATQTAQRFMKDVWEDKKIEIFFHAFHTMRVNNLLNRKKSTHLCPPFFMVVEEIREENETNLKCLEIEGYNALSQDQRKNVTFAFIDPTTNNNKGDATMSLGWTLRNFIAYLTLKMNLAGNDVEILSFRPAAIRRIHDASSSSFCRDDTLNDASLLLKIHLPEKEDYFWPNYNTNTDKKKYTCMGWELNVRGRPGPRVIDLSPLLSPAHLVEQATDLNLKLMKWRMIPDLNLQLLSQIRVVLLGAGTLGCSVARTLLGWGVRNFTFVDNGKVSYSNPVRQNLFELKDCEHGGTDKALAAAEALKKIAGQNIQSEGHILTIPMPGHSVEEKEEEGVRNDIEKIGNLIDQADVVFLLTDTRESRWLPTVMARTSNKMLINAALGLDSWLVMRHGGNEDGRLGCYFCNDVVAPDNSTNNRTLDQQCTVTRPGLAPIASSMAVELMVALLHHKSKQDAPAPKPTATTSSFAPTVNNSSSPAVSPLGIMPHQIRGSIVTYTMMTPTVPAFRFCTACSSPVIEAYKKDKFDFVKKVCCDDGSFLETISELTAFRDAATQKIDCIDWEADSDDEF